MGGKHTGANYDLAKAEADKVDAQIIETLKTGHSFRVEAGAGSGKTYSLNRVIEWIQANKWSDYSRKKQNVVCITYTNAAVDVIAERLAKDSFILPSTIHSFAWNAIKQYQSVLIDAVTTNPDFLPDEGDFNTVSYTHLDVYKRQRGHSPVCGASSRRSQNSWRSADRGAGYGTRQNSTMSPRPVSYTHLPRREPFSSSSLASSHPASAGRPKGEMANAISSPVILSLIHI